VQILAFTRWARRWPSLLCGTPPGLPAPFFGPLIFSFDTTRAAASESSGCARRRRGDGVAHDAIAEVPRSDGGGAEATRAIAEFAVVGDYDDPVGPTQIWPPHRLDDAIVCRAPTAVAKDLERGVAREGAVDCGFVRAQPHIVPSTDKVVPVDEHALRSHEQLPLLIYHLMMLLCVDLDGVLYRGSEPIPGVGSLLTERVAAGDRVAYITNNSFLRRDEYRARIESCGAPFSDAALFTAVDLTAARFRAAGAQKILVYGAAGLVDELRAAGLDARATAELGDEAALAAWGANGVCVGLHRHATQRELALATAALRAGARFITPNRDAAYPDPGELTPGTGAAVAALEAASGVRAEVVGKPAPDLILAAAEAANAAREDVVMIGDSLATDIAAAEAAGVRSVLMLTGVTSEAEAARAATAGGAARPTCVARNAGELAELLGELRAN
jgi:4-nitrophenyl phosphatase